MAYNIDKKNTEIPFYIQLKMILKEMIENDYSPGELIPTEVELQKRFEISRITVRDAISELVNEGYLKRKRGKGTIVLPKKIEEPLSKIKSFTDEMKERGFLPSTKSIDILITKAFDDVCKALNVKTGEQVYKISRVRCADNEPIVYFETYMNMNMKIDLDINEYSDSLYEYLKRVKKINIKYAEQRISACSADEKISNKLEIKKGEPVLLLKRKSFDEENKIIEYTKGYYISNRYEYFIKLKGE